jgi:predicted DNA-binding transcriptional regulator AlpA
MVDTEPSQGDPETIQPVILIPKQYRVENWVLPASQVAETLDISEATLRGWISRGQFPTRDGETNGKSPYWKMTTVLEYLRFAPGGRLGYQVG